MNLWLTEITASSNRHFCSNFGTWNSKRVMLNFPIFAFLFGAPSLVHQERIMNFKLIEHLTSTNFKLIHLISNSINMSGLELSIFCHICEDNNNNKSGLGLDDRRRCSQKIPRIALKRHSESAAWFLIKSGNDQALITCCAVTHKVFAELLELGTGLIKKLKPSRIRRGRPQEVNAVSVLGLALSWHSAQGSPARAISLAFDLTAADMCG